jgi:hypothetical protein
MGSRRLKGYIEYIYTCTELVLPMKRVRLKRYLEYIYTCTELKF